MQVQPLNYATPGAPDVSRPRHPWPVTLLMVAGVIAFFAVGGWGLMCIDVLSTVPSVLMILGAAMFLIVVLGLLARPRPMYTFGAVLTLGAALAAGVATLLTHAATVSVRQRIMMQNTALGGVVVISSASDAGKALGILQSARFVNASAAVLAFCLFIYLVICSFHRRPRWG